MGVDLGITTGLWVRERKINGWLGLQITQPVRGGGWGAGSWSPRSVVWLRTPSLSKDLRKSKHLFRYIFFLLSIRI